MRAFPIADYGMNKAILVLLIIASNGCSIPVYSVQTEYYGNRSTIERELDQIIANDMGVDDALSILKKSGLKTELVTANDSVDSKPMIVATKRTALDEQDATVSMPINNEHVARPFRIEWIDIESGKIVASETIGEK